MCLPSVPLDKTSTAFVKPVDYLVRKVIAAQIVFRWRGLSIGRTYLNYTLIPMLCRKAGLAEADARGMITRHRARATILGKKNGPP